MNSFKRELLEENTKGYKNTESQLKRLKPYLNGVKSNYEKLTGEKFTNDIFCELLEKGVSRIENKLNNRVKEEIKKSGITLPSFKNEITSKVKNDTTDLKKAVRALKSFCHRAKSNYSEVILKPEFIFYGERSKSFYINDQKEEELKELYFRVYIESPGEKEIYESFLKVVSAYEQFTNKAEEAIKANGDFNGITYLRNFFKDPYLIEKMKAEDVLKVDNKRFLSFIRHRN